LSSISRRRPAEPTVTKGFSPTDSGEDQIFESYCRLVGDDELADRVRRSASRSSGGETEPVTDGPEPEGPLGEDPGPPTDPEPSGAVEDQGTAEP
jgi:hypothetical protein